MKEHRGSDFHSIEKHDRGPVCEGCGIRPATKFAGGRWLCQEPGKPKCNAPQLGKAQS